MHRLPLGGVTVVALEQAVSGPFATRQLADLGARVIKIERPGDGDFARHYDTTVRGLSSWFVWQNRTKESVTLDLKRPEAAVVLERLLARADVFLQNLAPGSAARMGLGSKDLRARYPRLVICNISGYGTSGPHANRKAYDTLVQNEVGVVSLTGTPDAPCKAGVSIADVSAAMYAYSGILTGLLARKDTGEGTVLDVSLLDSLGEWIGAPAYYTEHSGSQPARTGASHATIAPYGPFRAGDGEVVLAVQNQREWVRLCTDVLGQPALADDERFRTNELRVRHRAALQEAIDATFITRSSAEVLARLDAAGIANARMNTVHEYLDHPQLASRECWREVESPVGPLRALLPPVRMEGVEPAMGPIPALGQHTDAVLAELGFDRGTVAAWREQGVV